MELWDILDERGRRTGERLVRGERLLPGQYHLVVHIWVIDSQGRLLIQQRSPALRLMPGRWAATGGSAVSGEDGETAARRELQEELGLVTAPGELELITHMRRRHTFTDMWLLRRDVKPEEIVLQKEEVHTTKWVTCDGLRRMIEQGRFHNYGTAYYRYLFEYIEQTRSASR